MTTKSKTTTNKTITAKHYRHNREIDIAESNTSRVKIIVAPATGEKFNARGMEQAAKQAAITAYEMAAAYLRCIPDGCAYSLPDVHAGDTWAGGASAFVTFDHDGFDTAIAAVLEVVETASE